jgi:O-antigen/teichoic acid export membrane protein
MSNPKKPLNEVDIFSDLSLTARRIISQLLERNEKLQQENQLLKNKTKESLNDNIRSQSRSETLQETNNNSKPHKRISSIAKITKKIGVDSAVLSTGIARVVATLISPITAVLMIRFLNLAEQGYWYTFLSFIAISQYAELGMGQVVMQFSSHEWAKIEDLSMIHSSPNGLRLKSIFRIAILLGGSIATLASLISFILGYSIMQSHTNDAGINWQAPWLCVSLISALNITVAYVNGFMDGCQMFVTTNLRRSIQSCVSLAALFIVFSMGGKLWALGLSQLASLVVGIILMFVFHKEFFQHLFKNFYSNTYVSWRREIFPLQWRFAATWLTGIFVFQLFNPMLFGLVGPEAAGRFGFTLSIIAVVNGYAQIWIAARAPVFASLNSSGKWDELSKLFRKSLISGTVTYAIGSIIVMSLAFVVQYFYPSLSSRFIDPLSIMFLLAGQGINLVTFAFTYFVRSFKEEPFVLMAWIHAFLSVILVPICVSLFEIKGAALASLLSNAAVFPIGFKIYRLYASRMHMLRLSTEVKTGQV